MSYLVARRKKRDQSMPAWANKNKIDQFYIQARQLTEETGIPHEVDHIIPSNHPSVCGLHVENNLQILTKSENRRKSNSFNF
jgi:5-methylcytosine-specific restriction endonuclease McrA